MGIILLHVEMELASMGFPIGCNTATRRVARRDLGVPCIISNNNGEGRNTGTRRIWIWMPGMKMKEMGMNMTMDMMMNTTRRCMRVVVVRTEIWALMLRREKRTDVGEGGVGRRFRSSSWRSG